MSLSLSALVLIDGKSCLSVVSSHGQASLPAKGAKVVQYFLDYSAAVGTRFWWTGADNQKRLVNFNPAGNVTVFWSAKSKENKGCKNQSKRGKQSRSILNRITTAHKQLATWSFFFSNLCRGKKRFLNSQACEVDYMYSLF